MAFLAIGDPIRMGGGIPIPNYRMTRITGYSAASAAASGVLPDGWTINRFGGGVGGITPNIVEGWSSRLALRLASTPPGGGNNDIYAPPSRGGVIPNFTATGQSLRVRVLAMYRKTGITAQTVTPMIAFYNRLETSVFYYAFPVMPDSSSWALYDDSAVADMSSPALTALGWADPYIDHAYLFFRMGGAASLGSLVLGEVAAMWSLTIPGGNGGFDQMATRSDIGSVEFYEQDLGRFERLRTGHTTWEDMTGGQQPRIMSAEFAALTDADVKLLTFARNLNRGSYVALPSGSPATHVIPVAAAPIVVEIPYWQQDLSQGPRPYFMYANLVEAPRWKFPNGYLTGRKGTSLVFEETEG